MIDYVDSKDAVPCTFCNQLTYHTGTKKCDLCWELEHRIKHTPEIARAILRDIDMEEQVEKHGTG